MEDYGKLLDHEDYMIKQTVKNDDELYYANIEKLRKIFFNDVINRMHKNGTVLVTGPTVPKPNDIGPFLYFQNSVSLQICPTCPQAKNPSLLRPYLEKGLISVFLISDFSSFNEEFQKLAFEYPEYFVGPHRYFGFKFFKLNDSLPHKPIEDGGTCLHCEIHDKLHQSISQFARLRPESAYFVYGISGLIKNIPTKVADYAANLFVDTLRNPNENALRELDITVNLMYYLSSSYAVDSIPQINAEFLKSSDLFLEPLRIKHHENIDLGYYLDIVSDFRGTLSPKVLKSEKNSILSQIIKINEEIDKIESSKRLPMGLFLYKFSTSVPSIISRILTQGTYGAEGIQLESLKKFKVKNLTEIKSKLLSKYFGVSKTGIQVWQIRRKLNS